MWISASFLLLSVVTETFGECRQTEERNIFLWSVRHPTSGTSGFLFGTIHVPYTEVWDKVSDRVREAFSFSDTVMLEVDLQNEDTIRKLIKCKNLPKRKTAQSYLPPELFNRIQKFMSVFRNNLLLWAEREAEHQSDAFIRAKEIFENLAGSWQRKRPEWLLFSLYQMCENMMERPASPMLDVFLAQKAIEENKSIKAIETSKEQCHPISSIGTDDIVFAINYTMYYLEHLHSSHRPFSAKKERSITDLVEHYRCGSLEDQLFNTNELTRRGFEMSKEERERARMIDVALKEDIIVRRNERMATRLADAYSQGGQKTIFTAIGTGHFLGNRSIITHLQRMGYQIEAIRNDDMLMPPNHDRPNLRRFNALWTREHGPDIPDVVIELVQSSSSSLSLSCFWSSLSTIFTLVAFLFIGTNY